MSCLIPATPGAERSLSRTQHAWCVLGIETSCDETAAAVVVRHADGRGAILANVVRSQWEQHAPFGGVVPEIAARAHVECLDEIVREALEQAGVTLGEISAVAATAGPGLIGGLLVGLVTGKAIAAVQGVPFVAVNHLEAHALTVGLTHGLAPPYLLLLVSGGHTLTVRVDDVGRYTRLGTTLDDALGEAFDKTAKLLGLGAPGGPQVERLASAGDPTRFHLPTPMLGRAEPHFSFAGLKTAVRQLAIQHQPLSETDVADMCAAFQASTVRIIVDRLHRAIVLAGEPLPALVAAGGVAANAAVRAGLAGVAEAHGMVLVVPPAALCTDNAAMVAWAGALRAARGEVDALDVGARARWPLDSLAEPVLGSGRQGGKA